MLIAFDSNYKFIDLKLEEFLVFFISQLLEAQYLILKKRVYCFFALKNTFLEG